VPPRAALGSCFHLVPILGPAPTRRLESFDSGTVGSDARFRWAGYGIFLSRRPRTTLFARQPRRMARPLAAVARVLLWVEFLSHPMPRKDASAEVTHEP
jgi:hypothetical protein